MEISPLLIYFGFQADNIVKLFVLLAVTSCTCAASAWIVFLFSDTDDAVHARTKILPCIFIPLSLLFSTCVAFMPNSKTIAAMYVIPKLVKSDATKQLSGDAQKLYKLGIMALETHIQSVSRKDERR